MQIELNGAQIETRATTLAELIAEQDFEATSVATARNGAFVPQAARARTDLIASDKIEVLSPMQGG
ncbi:sulfur carrier protein ThiS [Thioclava sp. BHET1]|nr:sulfur carrier protein ThiS [Thioclava sp. BHET1]